MLIGKVGEGQPETSMAKLLDIANIHLLGPKDYKKLPDYLHYFDICTIPTPVNDYTNSMFPMKFYEFMAAGKPIVARNIDSLKELKDAHYSYSTPSEFVEQIDLALNNGIKDSSLCDKLAKENTWEVRLEKMLAKLNL